MAAAASPTRAYIQKLVDDNFITVFSKSYCQYCKRAKALLKEVAPDKHVHVVELDQVPHMQEYQQILGEMTGRRTVPLIFIGGKFVGGSDDIYKLHNDGKLRPLVAAAPARAR